MPSGEESVCHFGVRRIPLSAAFFLSPPLRRWEGIVRRPVRPARTLRDDKQRDVREEKLSGGQPRSLRRRVTHQPGLPR